MTKIFKQLESVGLAFFRMKLKSDHVLISHDRCKVAAVVRGSNAVMFINALHAIGMNKIEVSALLDRFRYGVGPMKLDGAPPHVG